MNNVRIKADRYNFGTYIIEVEHRLPHSEPDCYYIDWIIDSRHENYAAKIANDPNDYFSYNQSDNIILTITDGVIWEQTRGNP